MEQWIGGILAGLDGPERALVIRRLARDLRNANAKRIRANVDPDGNAFEPRKPREGRIRKRRDARQDKIKTGRMYRVANTARLLGRKTTPNGIDIGFVGTAARILAVHQHGLDDRVAPFADAPTVKYPQRRLLGFAAEDEAAILQTLTDWIDRISST